MAEKSHGLSGLKKTEGLGKKAAAESVNAKSIEKKTGKGDCSNWPKGK